MSETYLRQWTMLRHIPRLPRKIPSGRILDLLRIEGYQVSKRTIERDLSSLSTIFPITCDDRSKPYGWSWAGNDVLDIPSMDIPVALTFSLVSHFLQPLMPPSSRQHLAPHFQQAEKILSNTEKSGQGKWLDKVRVIHQGQNLLPADVPAEILDAVYEALLTDKRVDICYQASANEESQEFEVNPLGLVFRDATVYLVSTLWNYNDIKQLVLHRIKSASISEKSKRIPKEFNLDRYIDSGEFGYKLNDKSIKVEILLMAEAGKHLCETKLSDDQVSIEQPDGQLLITATVQDTQALRWWLMSFGEQIEVIKPMSIRAEFKKLAQQLVEKYS